MSSKVQESYTWQSYETQKFINRKTKMYYLETHRYAYLTISVGTSTDISIYFICTHVYTYPYIPAVLTHIMLAIILWFSNIISLLLSLLFLHSEVENSSTKNIYNTFNLHCTAQVQGPTLQIFIHASNLLL